PRGEPALGEAAQGAPSGKRRPCVRLLRGRRALDSGTATALLAAAREMSEPFLRRKVQCASAGGLHRVAYLEWGERSSGKTLVCVHGLTRCARDFDRLAAEMVGTTTASSVPTSPGAAIPTGSRIQWSTRCRPTRTIW